MSIKEIESKVQDLRALKRMQEDLTAEIASIEDEIKAVITAQETETLTGADWKVTWKAVTSNRLDSTALRKELPDIAARFMKQTTCRRFCVA